MSWICKRCETENPDTHDVCEVCDAQAPYVMDFVYDKVLSDDIPIKLSWESKFCDKIVLVYARTEVDVTGKNSYELVNPADTYIKFLLSNDVVDNKAKGFHLKFYPKPIVKITSDKQKLKKGKNEKAVIRWDIKNAYSAILVKDGTSIKINKKGKDIVSPNESVVYKIEVVALDKKTKFVESLQVQVFDECTINFNADKYYIYPTIPVTLKWSIKNAKTVWFESEEVEPNGTRIVEPKKATSYVLRVEDEFGMKEKRIDIQMLPIPLIKAVFAPTPKIDNNLSVIVTQPRFNVGVSLPKIEMKMVTMKPPEVPSLTDLGINVELSSPLPRLGFVESIKRLFNRLKWE